MGLLFLATVATVPLVLFKEGVAGNKPLFFLTMACTTHVILGKG